MILIHFGTWNNKAGMLLTFDRVFLNNGKPTPLVVAKFRHVGMPPI